MNLTTQSIMSSPLICVDCIDSAEKAYIIMKRNKIRHLPVADVTGKIVGIISDRDLHRAMTNDLRDYVSLEMPLSEFNPRVQVQDLMSWPVRSVDIKTPISEIAQGMISEKISAYLVTDEERVVGIITHEDLLSILVRLIESQEEDVPSKKGFRLSGSLDKWLGAALKTSIGESI